MQELKRPPNVRWYGVRGVVTVGETPITIFAEHPPAPFAYEKWVLRNEEFDKLAATCKKMKAPVVVIGDMNSTPWSPYLKGFLRESELQDTETGHGVQPTWSTQMPLPLVPIDHCFTSQNIRCSKRSIGPFVGSDHLPVFVELYI